jgi:hypothetical protein
MLMRDLEFKITISQTLAFPNSPPTYLPSVTNHIASYSNKPAFPSLYFFLPFPLDSTQQLRLISGSITITPFPFHPRPTSLISPNHPPLSHNYLSPPPKHNNIPSAPPFSKAERRARPLLLLPAAINTLGSHTLQLPDEWQQPNRVTLSEQYESVRETNPEEYLSTAC